MGLVTSMWIAGTIFLFKYPQAVNFATWSGLVVTITGVFHWLTIRDAKLPDAGGR